MKTRTLAKSLRFLADWLESLPDQSLEELTLSRPTAQPTAAALALNVATLASLSRVNRSAWIEFITEHQFPIEVRSRDASRDVLGKLLKYLEQEPEAVDYLRRSGTSNTPASSELSRALKALLNYPG